MLDQISRKVEGNESRGEREGAGEWKRRRRKSRDWRRESWRVVSRILSQYTVTCSGFWPQAIQFPPSSLPQALLAVSGSNCRETTGISVHVFSSLAAVEPAGVTLKACLLFRIREVATTILYNDGHHTVEDL